MNVRMKAARKYFKKKKKKRKETRKISFGIGKKGKKVDRIYLYIGIHHKLGSLNAEVAIKWMPKFFIYWWWEKKWILDADILPDKKVHSKLRKGEGIMVCKCAS